jgi:hypothetical protein
VSYDASGVWNPYVYRGLVAGSTIAQIGGAFWEGAETRSGKTMWQGTDAELIAGVSADAGKHVFTCARPDEGNNPARGFREVLTTAFRATRLRRHRLGDAVRVRVRFG